MEWLRDGGYAEALRGSQPTTLISLTSSGPRRP